MDGDIQKALDISIACEDNDLRNLTENFAEQYLKSAYLVSAQLLTAQGKFSMARDRLAKAKKLPDNFLIELEPLLDTTEGYLLERTGETEKAINYYRKIAKTHALVRLGAIYFDQSNKEEAYRVIANCLKESPSNPAAHAILGEILEGSDKAAALQEYDQALAFASQGNPTVVALVYLEVARAKKGIARLHK
jgi:tetratricopeptide (TPR) repeat protein